MLKTLSTDVENLLKTSFRMLKTQMWRKCDCQNCHLTFVPRRGKIFRPTSVENLSTFAIMLKTCQHRMLKTFEVNRLISRAKTVNFFVDCSVPYQLKFRVSGPVRRFKALFVSCPYLNRATLQTSQIALECAGLVNRLTVQLKKRA